MFKMFILLLCYFSFQCQNFCYASDSRLTPAYFVTSSKIELGKHPIGKHPTTFVINATDPKLEEKTWNISANAIPVIINADIDKIPFDVSSYFQQLKTRKFGRNFIVGDRIPTTMNIAHDFGDISGLLVIANEQTRGRGNHNTSWQSPRGDQMITVIVNLKNQSQSNLLAAHCVLSMMKAVLTSPGGDYSKLPIKFSWPISLHWSTWNKKIGGVLVEQIENREGWYASGCGLRVNSEIPYSVSRIIEEYNINHGVKLKQLSLPPLIARTMNYMEEYLDLMENEPEQFQKLVMDNWMNSDQTVKIDIKAEIKGITKEGHMIFDDDKGFRGYLKPDNARFNTGIIVT